MSVYGSYVGRDPRWGKREMPNGLGGITILMLLFFVVSLFYLGEIVFTSDRVVAAVARDPPFGIPALATLPGVIAFALAATASFGIIAIGFLNAWRPAWTITLVLLAYRLAVTGVRMATVRVSPNELIDLAITVGLAYYFTRPDVKAYFRVARPS